MTSAPRRVAIVGCGGIARTHAEAVAATDGFELAALVDVDAVALDRAQDELDVPGFASIDALLEGPTIDVACVCTPPVHHRPVAERLLREGFDVLCEKPLAISAEDARALRVAADAAGRNLAVSDKFRHVGDLREAAERLRSGMIGDPIAYEVAFCAPVNVRGRWPSNPRLSGGGVLMDNGPHAFDVLSHVLDSPIAELSGWLAKPVLVPSVEDSATIVFRTDAGATGRIELSWVYFSKDLDYLVVHGTEGTLRTGWTGGHIRRHGERMWTDFGSGYDKAAAFRGVWRTFAEGTRQIDPPSPSEALAFIERAYRTAEALPRS